MIYAYLKSAMVKKIILNTQPQTVFIPLLLGMFVLCSWQMAVDYYEIAPYILPAPLLITKTLIKDWPILGPALWTTLKITLLSLLLATILGVCVSFLFSQNRAIERALFPYAVLLQVTPIVAIAPLIIIWIRDTTFALVICASLVALFPIISNTTLGLKSVDPDLLSFFKLHRASNLQILLRLRIPSAMPYFFGGLRISSGLALIGAVVSEFVAGTGGSGSGLAYEILQSGFQLNIPRLFAALVLITFAGVAMFMGMAQLTNYILKDWHASEIVIDR